MEKYKELGKIMYILEKKYGRPKIDEEFNDMVKLYAETNLGFLKKFFTKHYNNFIEFSINEFKRRYRIDIKE